MFGDHPRWRGMNKGPGDFGLSGETASFDSIDGVHLKAWWLPASCVPRATIIVAHGIDHTRQVMLPRAVFLVKGGYDVLLLDLRGHGESGGSIVSPGLLEARDVLVGIRYIRSRGDNEPIAVLGVSYGAVASLIAAAGSPDVAAVISDGAFLTGKQLSADISRHYFQDSRTNFPGPGAISPFFCSGRGSRNSTRILPAVRNKPRAGAAFRDAMGQPRQSSCARDIRRTRLDRAHRQSARDTFSDSG